MLRGAIRCYRYLLIKQALPGSFVFDFEDTAGPDAEGSVYGAPMAVHRRAGAAAAAVLTVAAGLALRGFAGGALAKYGGVALWAALVYALVVVLRPRARPGMVATVALAISFAVELFQLTPYPAALAARHPLFHLVLGEMFHAPDLLAYALGAGLAWAVDRGARRA